jgi:hypothetical protein
LANGAEQHRANGRRPPLAAAMRGGDALVVERSSDLAEAATSRIFELDAGDDRTRKRGWASGGPAVRTGPARLDVFLDEPLELVNGNEPLTPRQLRRLDGRHDSPVDCRDADTQGFGGLSAGVGETRDLTGLGKLVGPSSRQLGYPALRTALSLSTPFPSCAHLPSYTNPRVG